MILFFFLNFLFIFTHLRSMLRDFLAIIQHIFFKNKIWMGQINPLLKSLNIAFISIEKILKTKIQKQKRTAPTTREFFWFNQICCVQYGG